jgi:hypothetical protein
MKILRLFFSIAIALITIFSISKPALAFCGFYVAKADANLYNQASQVIIARDKNRTILTMANDYQGEVKDFALVVPVPVVLKQEQVHVGEPKILERLDAFSAPRLVEYFDDNPCEFRRFPDNFMLQSGESMQRAAPSSKSSASLGVTIEEKFSVGEYDILILSAKESNGLQTWLDRNGYKIPKGASKLLTPYIRQNLKFFVAKVNLQEFDEKEFQSLRPLQIAYESSKFMLPIRLGTINAQKEQDLIVYLLSPKGQIELTNYRTVKVPSDADIPEFVKSEFNDFYKAMFQTAYEKENKKVAFVEYAWDMGSCDPCSAEPLNSEELKDAGVFWQNSEEFNSEFNNVFLTRLHIRYTRDRFPEDLKFQETANRQSFQGRYVIRHPYQGEISCDAARSYRREVKQRQEREVQTLAKLTGWDTSKIRTKVKLISSPVENESEESEPWWDKLWSR